MSLNLKVGIKDLSISRYDPMSPEKWRDDTLSVVATLGVDHMLSGDYNVKSQGREDPYLELIKQKTQTRVEQMLSSAEEQRRVFSQANGAEENQKDPQADEADEESKQDTNILPRDDDSVISGLTDLHARFAGHQAYAPAPSTVAQRNYAPNAGVLGEKYALALLERTVPICRY